MNRKNKAQDNDSIDVILKKKSRKKSGSTQALALSLEAVRDFVDGKRSFFHISSNDKTKIPYVLPFDIMDVMCYCGKIFSNKSASSIGRHFFFIPNQCIPTPTGIRKVEYLSEEYDDLEFNPEYSYDKVKHRVVLRFHKNSTMMTCICGEVKCYGLLIDHMKHCKSVDYAREYNNSNFYTVIPSEHYISEPKLELCSYLNNKEEKISIDKLNLFPFPFSYGRNLTDEEKKRTKKYREYMRIYYPLKDKRAKFIIPRPLKAGHDEIVTKIRRLNIFLTCNFDKLHFLKKSVDIQANRVEIDLTLTAMNRDTGYFKKFCDNHNYNFQEILHIKNYCTEITMMDVGDDFKHSCMGTFSLISTKNPYDQMYHLDILGKSNKQYVMMIGDRCKTTKICESKSSCEIKNLNDLAIYLTARSKHHRSWLEISSKFKSLIERLPPDSKTSSYISNGVTELLKISSNEKLRLDDYDSKYISDSRAGTFVTAEGNIIHAGTGVGDHNVRNVLFFTYCKKKYNTNTQYSKLTVIVAVLEDLWKQSDVRLDLLKLVYYCFNTTSIIYQETCLGSFQHFSGLYNLLIELNSLRENKTNNEKNILEMLKLFSYDNDFLKNKHNREERAKNRGNVEVQKN